MARGETRGALVGGITGLLLSLADIEGSLASRLRLTLMVGRNRRRRPSRRLAQIIRSDLLARLFSCRVRCRFSEPGRQGPAFFAALRRHLASGRRQLPSYVYLGLC